MRSICRAVIVLGLILVVASPVSAKSYCEVGFSAIETGQYHLLRYAKNFGEIGLFGQLTRDQFGKTLGLGIRYEIGTNFYLFYQHGQGIDNVDQINRRWVYSYPEELVVQHSYIGGGMGYHYFWNALGIFIEYSRERFECGDHRGGSWAHWGDKISLGVTYGFQLDTYNSVCDRGCRSSHKSG